MRSARPNGYEGASGVSLCGCLLAPSGPAGHEPFACEFDVRARHGQWVAVRTADSASDSGRGARNEGTGFAPLR